MNEPTNRNSIKVSKVVQPAYKKRYYKTLRTSVTNSPLSPPSPTCSSQQQIQRNIECTKVNFKMSQICRKSEDLII